jgi:hypothetical protein
MTGQAGLNAEAGASLATANYLPRFVEHGVEATLPLHA